MSESVENLVLKMSVNNLKNALRERGVKHLRDMRKAELQERLLKILREEDGIIEESESEPEPEPEVEVPQVDMEIVKEPLKLSRKEKAEVNKVRKELIKLHGEKAKELTDEVIWDALKNPSQ